VTIARCDVEAMNSSGVMAYQMVRVAAASATSSAHEASDRNSA
jgi:hypothetical protein